MAGQKRLYLQYAALPFRLGTERLEVMLVTSRETRRWVIPKGWPEGRMKPHLVAEMEAFEEAGVRGEIALTPIAAFEYVKLLPLKQKVSCLVEVFPLRVLEIAERWPEQSQRQRRWMAADEAATLVQEKGLKQLLLSFAATPDQADFAN